MYQKQNHLQQAVEASRSFLNRHGLYNDGFLTLNGASVATSSCLLSMAWFILVPSLLISLITLFAISRPTSLLMTVTYYANCLQAILFLAASVLGFQLFVVVGVGFQSQMAIEQTDSISMTITEEQARSFSRAIKGMGKEVGHVLAIGFTFVWLFLIQMTCFIWYTTVAALRHVRKTPKQTLPK